MLNNPTSGSYLLGGKDVSTLKESERTLIRRGMIGFVFQSFNLIDELNVVENIELPLLYMGISGKERRKRAEDVMERVAISHRAKHFPSQLSGGQQQRTAIARAILPGDDKAGFIMTTLLGIAGSLLATYGGRFLGLYDENSAAGFIASVIGALIILFIYNMISKRSHRV